MRLVRGLIFGLIIGLADQHPVFADDAALIEATFRAHAEAVAKAELARKRTIEKAQDDALTQLTKLTVKAYKANDRIAETMAWKAILRLDSTHKKAVQYFTDLGILDKVLAEIGNPNKPAEPVKGKPAADASAADPAFAKWMIEVAALPPKDQIAAVMQKLVLLNPQFDKTSKYESVNGVVTELTLPSDKLVNLAPLRALRGLTKLECPATAPNENQLVDLSPLKGLPLTHLSIKNTHVRDLSPLVGMKLTLIDLSFTPVSDLSPLKGMPLVLIDCNQTLVEDLTPLKGIKLVTLSCSGTKVVDLSPLAGMPLGTLNCIDTKVADLSPLTGMSLGVLSAMNTQISDLKPLAGMPITGMSINGTRVTDLSPLRGMRIEVLYCQNTKIAQLAPLRGMPLKRLYCDLKQQSDIPILRGIKTLETINDLPAAQFWSQLGVK